MIKMLRELFGAVQRDDLGTPDLTKSLTDAEREVAAAAAALEAAEAGYKAGLLSADDARLRQLDDARTEARLRGDRAKALRTAIAEKLATAREREAEASRRAAYEAAEAQAAEARQLLQELYPEAARDIVKIIVAVASAEAAVRAANADLPDGAPPLAAVEGTVRNVGTVGRRLVSERTVTRWCREGERHPGSLDQDQVQVNTDGYGYLRPAHNQIEYVVARKFRERVYEQDETFIAYHLAQTVSLPGLGANDVPFWKPLPSNPKPGEVLNAAARLTQQAAVRAARQPSPQVTTELELLDEFDSNESARPGPDLTKALIARGELASPNNAAPARP
jgi:hypothetical protein